LVAVIPAPEGQKEQVTQRAMETALGRLAIQVVMQMWAGNQLSILLSMEQGFGTEMQLLLRQAKLLKKTPLVVPVLAMEPLHVVQGWE